MAFKTGNVNSFQDLLTEIKSFALDSGWALVKDDGGSISGREIMFKNIDSTVFVGFKTYFLNTGFTRYNNLLLNVFDAYNSSLGFYAQSGSNINTSSAAPAPILTLSDNPMKYWFFFNDRRLIIVVYAEQKYVVSYLGKFLPFAAPSQYTKPFLCGGTGLTQTDNLTSKSMNFANMFEYLTTNTGTLQTSYMMQVKDHTNTWNIQRWATNAFFTSIQPSPYTFHTNVPDDLVINAWPKQIYNNEYCLGEVDGIYETERFNINAEDTVTIESVEYIAFPHVGNNTNYKSYFLVKK